ncbi:hypothetical protein F511_15161 [Dorcoceras hygrometricum]|uniref:Uncharacterized protein n=1 Tax=Dorcoceras hygrometricum TaxID=472368 RepID=A0A2Z7B9Z5_9LAMI|nr:hypothetical protein F511_15161 [Dorcoceras hygrometricum]
MHWSKISSWNSKGTPKLIRQFTYRSAGNIKLVHQLDVGAARSMKSSSSAESRAELKCRVEVQNAQVHNSSIADQVQYTKAVIECEDRTSWKVSKGRRAASTRRETSSRCPPWTRKNMHAGGALEQSSSTQDGSPKKTSLREQLKSSFCLDTRAD